MVGWRLLSLLLLASVALAQDSYALIAGTVFRPNGASMAAAEVSLTPEKGVKSGKKPKSQKQTSNQRGEFTFRVPAGAMRYTLSVHISGYKPLTKVVEIAGDERQDVSLLLEPGT